jgi:hypothetical protein
VLLVLCAACRYEFGIVDANNVRKVLAVNPALPFLFKGLPEGAVTLYVCAVDSYGARECAQEGWTVKPAAADFKLADALTSISVEQLEKAGDVSVMAAGAQALQSLSKFADASAGTQTEAVKQQIQSAIAAKTSSMIGSLASTVADLVDDPNTMAQVRGHRDCLKTQLLTGIQTSTDWTGQCMHIHFSANAICQRRLPTGVLCLLLLQVVSTVATLSKTTSTLSADAKSKMVNVGKAGIAAAKLSHKPLTPEAGSRLIAVLAAGKGISAACQLSSCKAATAAIPAATRHLLEVSFSKEGGGVLHVDTFAHNKSDIAYHH